MAHYLFTSESVSMGHPDKVSDQISDAILDAMIADDPHARVACETLVATGLVVVAGEVTTKTYVDIPEVVRRTIEEIGYTDAHMRFDSESCAVMVALNKQSADIAQGVDREGAGDQGMMFGYACRETDPPTLRRSCPCRSHLSAPSRRAPEHKCRANGHDRRAAPDAKSQVTVEYENDANRSASTTVVISAPSRTRPSGCARRQEGLNDARQ